MRGFLIAVLIVASYFGGWLAAHDEVNAECVRQGSFYVGNNTFDCSLRKEPTP